jgi:Rha family phage regulatory protein
MKASKKIVTKADISKAVKISKTEPSVCSTVVAKVFGKQHGHILRDIENMKKDLSIFGVTSSKYFKDSSYIDSQNRTQKRYELSREGFDLIVLGFTGEKALKYKVWFIDEFHKKSRLITQHKIIAAQHQENPMWLELRNEGKSARKSLTDAIQAYELPQRVAEGKAHENFVATRTINYTQMLYKKMNINLPAGSNPRDVLDARTLIKLEDAELRVADFIEKNTAEGMHYKPSYQLIKESF